MSAERHLFTSGSPFEPQIGMSRAVRVGPVLAIAGTAPIGPDGKAAFPGDVYRQTQHCLGIVASVVAKAGARMDQVIRNRIMLTDIARWQEAAKAHGEVFGAIRPACTFVGISRFIDPDWLVEIETDLYIAD